MFYLKLLGEVLLVLLTLVLVGLTQPHPYIAGSIGLVLIVWFVWTLARVVRHVTQRPAESSATS